MVTVPGEGELVPVVEVPGEGALVPVVRTPEKEILSAHDFPLEFWHSTASTSGSAVVKTNGWTK